MEFKAGAYSATVSKRDNLSKYPTYPYVTRLAKATPKGKYAKEKILKNIVFKTEEQAVTYAKDYISNVQTNIEARKQRNASAAASEYYKEGDIVVNSWGYEQTNVEFYQVVAVNPKTIRIVEIGQAVDPGSEMSHGMACDVIPVKDGFLKEGRSYQLRVKASGYLSNPASYYYMHKWDGRPQYKSWYA